MASNYNMVGRPPVVAVRDGAARLLVRRETDSDLLLRDVGTHKGRWCQEGVRIWPGGYVRRRAGLTVLLDPSS
jgi:hypothetical protein